MPFDPTKDIPDLAGKVIFITGGTSGIGKATVLEFAAHSPSHIYFTGRNASAGSAVVAEAHNLAPDCNLTFIPCDLSSPFSTIRAALASSSPTTRLDLFIANAGIMAVPPALAASGYELQFATNVMGHALLLRLLLPSMLRTAALSPASDVRFISLTSPGHTLHPAGGIDFAALRRADAGSAWQRYGQSKLGNFVPVGHRAGMGGQAKAVEDEGLRERFWGWVEGELEGVEAL